MPWTQCWFCQFLLIKRDLMRNDISIYVMIPVIVYYALTTHTCFNSPPLHMMTTISQTILSNAFSWMKISVFWFQFHRSLFLRVQINNTTALVQVMAWRRLCVQYNKSLCLFYGMYCIVIHVLSSFDVWKTIRKWKLEQHSVTVLGMSTYIFIIMRYDSCFNSMMYLSNYFLTLLWLWEP